MKASKFKTIAVGMMEGMFKDVEFSTDRVDSRNLTVDEMKQIFVEEFKDAKDANKTKAKEVEDWGDAELEKEINWAKNLSLKEFFVRGK